MKRIDLHIHTLKTVSDNEVFEFSLPFLKSYIEFAKLDAIAITNHNTFNLAQFEEISRELDITVFPGVEVDLEKGHLLVIVPFERINDFHNQCLELTPLIIDQDSYIGIDLFKKIFSNYDDYLLIPHSDKNPKLKKGIIEEIGGITSGEVQSIKKFFYMKNDRESPTPLIFSDLRIYDRDDDKFHFPSRSTCINIKDIDIPSIKLALQDKNKVRITDEDINETFDIIPNEIQASTKLNLIVGKRSTGKTYTLDRILSTLQDNNKENVKYIKQFQIVNESEDKNFDIIKQEEKREMLHDYLTPIQKLIETIISIDINALSGKMKKYVDSLCAFADNQALNDEYSKCILFSESQFNAAHPKKSEELTKAAYKIFSETESKYEALIKKYLAEENLLGLTKELISLYNEEYIEYTFKNKVDEIIKPIQKQLGELSAIDPIEDTDFSDYFIKYKIVEVFNEFIKQINTEREINRKDLYRFDAILMKKPYQKASEISAEIGGKNYSSALMLYKQKKYYSYLHELVKLNADVELLHYGIFNCTLEICNKHDTPISHGERAEYNLLRNLENSYNYDALLLDEPEASFDNLFIYGFVIPEIKRLSEKLTVFLVTHNNTLGSNLLPDHIIYTKFDEEKYKTKEYCKEECFEVYSGSFDSKILTSSNRKHEANYDALMDTMEAGEKAYLIRRSIYENLRNKK